MDEIKCTKNDEFQFEPCNCPECLEERAGKIASMNAPVAVTDEHIVDEGKIHRWEGPLFRCPECGKPGVMAPIRYCIFCNKPIEYRSHILTEIIKKIQG